MDRQPTTELDRRLVERINNEGPMTFRDFMEAALYDPELGYYNTERSKIGPRGDYYTTSNVHPAFGSLLARAFAELWVDEDSRTILELGAGSGQLAFDVLSALRDEHPAILLNYVIVETSPVMRKRQQKKLEAFASRIEWRQMRELERNPVSGIAFSNEFVDAMPVHRIRFAGGVLQEQYVGVKTGRDNAWLTLLWDNPTTDRLIEYVSQAKVVSREGYILEVNLDAIDWLAQMAQALKRGFLVTIDYGDLAEQLYRADRRDGTLRSFSNHRLVDSPLARVGEQDITASVNFSALIEHGRRFGFRPVSYEGQVAFLERMGLIERITAVGNQGDLLFGLKDRLAIKNLFVPGGPGDSFRVLIQQKGF